MILRRVIDHVKHQNWTAVALDFVIVVVGVFIGIQVSNWNDAKNQGQRRDYYLERLQSDLNETIRDLSVRKQESAEALSIIDEFVGQLNNAAAKDDELISAANNYFSRGTMLLDFKVTRVTFDDLSATGNLEVLRNPKLITALIELNTSYALQNENVFVNTDWVMPLESQIASEFDWMRFDPKTKHLFPRKSAALVAADILAAEDELRRHAALHYWYLDNLKNDYFEVINQTQSVLDFVEREAGN